MLLIIKLLTPVSPVDYNIGGFVIDSAYLQGVRELSSSARKSSKRGGGLSLHTLRQNLERAYKIVSLSIANGEKCNDFEIKLYDNYHKVLTELSSLERSMRAFKNLPHSRELPNIYRLCSYIVKSSGGAVTERRFKQGIEGYCLDMPLCAREIMMLKSCLVFCLLEYLAIFASKVVTQNKIKQIAKRDAAGGRVNTEYLRYDTYAAVVINSDKAEFRRDYTDKMTERGLDIGTRLNEFAAKLSEYSGMVDAATVSLYGLSGWFNDNFTLSLSPTIKYLSGADGTIENLTNNTKFSYLTALQRKADRSDITELAAAHNAVSCAGREGKDISFCILPKKLGVRVFWLLRMISVLIALGLSAVVAAFVPVAGIAAAALFFFVINIYIYDLIIRLVGRFYPVHDYPQVRITGDMRAGAAIICCRFVKSEEELRDAINKMRTVMCANRGYNYGLLLDAPKELREAIKAAHGDAAGMFIAVRREAYERKRGAILQFNELVTKGRSDNFDFVLGDVGNCKYIITLDADSALTDADYLLRVMEHPYAESKNILSLPMRANPYTVKTPFSRLLCGGAGVSRYEYTSDSGDILFGKGNYTGKGIYRVREFNEILHDALPDGCILSHDLIEGAYAGCGTAHISGMDEFPHTYDEFLARQMRWLRGDVQLLPLTGRKVKSCNGYKSTSPVSSYYKCCMIRNVMSPLVSVFQIALVLMSVFTSTPILLALAFSREIIGILLAFRSIKGGASCVLKAIFCQLYQIITLPTFALSVLCAVSVTLLRLIRKKNLMCWTTFAHVKKKKLWYAANYAVAAYLIAFAFFSPYYIWLAVVAALMLSAPLVSKALAWEFKPRAVDNESAGFLRALGSSTWNYFKSIPDYALPPDNECDGRGWADRSSPTDIAMAITAAVAARDLGHITDIELIRKLTGHIDAVEKLKKHNGLPYNWYRASDGRPLKPQYVSSVDCGNLLAALLLASSFPCVKTRAEKLIGEMDFMQLYSGRRKLLHIGYNADEKRYDNSYYDLMGSEAVMTYLLCIGCGKLPVESYYSLSDSSLKSSGGCLVSWTGGMFEYTLPLLFLAPPDKSLIAESAKNVVRSHMRAAALSGESVWGRSESLYGAINDSGDYCYSAFGQPSIALSNKTMRKVAAPYASVTAVAADCSAANKLAAMLSPHLGEYGLPDAIDYDANKIIPSRMTHHQGMIMAALCLPLAGDSIRRRMSSLPEVRAAQLHLCLPADSLRNAKRKTIIRETKRPDERAAFARTDIPELAYLSNGEYVSVLDGDGLGYSMCDKLLLNRFDKPGGVELYANGESMTIGASAETFSGTVMYKKSVKDMLFDVKAYVLPDFAAEIREIKITNTGRKDAAVTFIAAFEPCLRPRMADISHKAYSSLFISVSDLGDHISAYRDDNGVALSLDDRGVKYNGSKQNFTRGTGLRTGSVVFPKLYASVSFTLAAGASYKTCVLVISGRNEIQMKYALSGALSEGYSRSALGKTYAAAKDFELTPVFRRLGSYLLYKKGKTNGKNPVVLLRAASEEKLSTEIRQLMLLRKFGVEFDVAVLYKENYGYKAEISDYVNRVMMVYGSGISAHNETYADKAVIDGLKASGVEPYKIDSLPYPPPQECRAAVLPNAPMPRRKVEYKLGLGGFTENGYYCKLYENQTTPAPWSNVFANPDFGAVITSSGGGFTFGANSQMQKLTAWSGDEFDDSASEGVIIGERGRFWSVTRAPVTRRCEYSFEHSVGHSRFGCNYNGILASQKVYISGKVKYYDVMLDEKAGKRRSLDLLFFARAVLGDFVQNTMGGIKFSCENGRATAENNGLKMTLSSSGKVRSYAFFAEAFMRGGKVCRTGKLVSVGRTPCPSILVKAELPAKGKVRVVFALALGDAVPDFNSASPLSPEYFITSSEKPHAYYLKWLFGQMFYSRFTARCGYQQVSGAYGFRDQLQDCLALLYHSPETVRKHILNAAEHQFVRGDVMHWWHEPRTGVRTRICDDRLYLPLAVCEYIDFTGDEAILKEKAAYLDDVILPEHQSSVYCEMTLSDTVGSIREHCMKAILSVELSDRGLVLMGGGDWNDGMDAVGEKGIGESVWCSMFLYYIVRRFIPYACEEEKKDMKVLMGILRAAVGDCFDGDRFIRAITDDGIILGSEGSRECKIDLLVQAWAVLSGIADRQSCRIALHTAYEKLVDEKNGIIKLLDPPYKELKVGYIAAYPKGVRENGGQYTHAAVWFVRAMYESGNYETAEKLLEMLLPSSHTRTKEDVERYRIEPYVIAADVYSGALNGQGGWSWYTGSAGWLYKTLIEYHYGIRISRGNIWITPRMKGTAEVTLSTAQGKIEISIDRKDHYGEIITKVGGITINSDCFSIKSLIGKKIQIG